MSSSMPLFVDETTDHEVLLQTLLVSDPALPPRSLTSDHELLLRTLLISEQKLQHSLT